MTDHQWGLKRTVAASEELVDGYQSSEGVEGCLSWRPERAVEGAAQSVVAGAAGDPSSYWTEVAGYVGHTAKEPQPAAPWIPVASIHSVVVEAAEGNRTGASAGAEAAASADRTCSFDRGRRATQPERASLTCDRTAGDI